MSTLASFERPSPKRKSDLDKNSGYSVEPPERGTPIPPSSNFALKQKKLPGPDRVVVGLSLYALMGGLVTLIGWFTHRESLTDWIGSGISMFANTALSAVCAGGALLIGIVRSQWVFVVRMLGLVVAVLGAATLFEHISGKNLGIDTLLVNPAWGQKAASAPGRMGPPASISFMLVGIALVWTRTRLRAAVPVLAVLVAAISLLGIIGHTFNADPLFAIAKYTGIAMQSATILFALAVALMASVPELNPTRTLCQKNAAGLLTRRVLPFVIVVPIVLGWLFIQGRNAGWIDRGTGMAMLVLALMALLCGLVWSCGKALTLYESASLTSEKRFQNIFSQTTAGIVQVDCEGRILLANQRFCEITGYSEDQLRQKTCAEITHPDDKASNQIMFENALREKKAYVIEKRYVRPDGSAVWVRNNVSPIFNSHGQPEHLLAASVDITDQKRAEQAMRENEKLLAMELADSRLLQEISTVLIQEDNPGVLYGKILDAAMALMRSDFAMMHRLEEKEDVLRALAWRGFSSEAGKVFELNRADTRTSGVLARKTGQRIIIPDIETSDVLAGTPELESYRQTGIRAVQSTPLFSRKGKLVGVISTHWRNPHQSSERELRLLDILARQTADLLERLQAEEALHQRTRLLEIINRTGATLAAELDLEKLVQAVTDAGREVSGAAFGAFFYNVKNEKGESYTLYTLSGAPREAFAKFPMPRNTALFGATFRGEGAIRIGDVLQDPRYGKNAPYHGMPEGHLPVRSYLATPVISRSGEAIGGLFYGHPEPDIFTEEAEKIVSAIAAQAAIAIDNARLYRQTQAELAVRKQAEEKMRAVVAKFEAVFNQSGIFAGIMEVDGKVIEVNDLSVDWCGYTKGEVLNKPFWETPWWRGSEEVKSRIRVATHQAAAGHVFRETLRYWLADGTERIVDFAMHPIRDDSRKVIFLHPSGIDVTDRKLAEEALREGEERFRMVADNISQLAWTCDHLGVATWYNRRWYDYTGLTFEEMRDWGWRSVHHPEHLNRVIASIESARDQGEVWEETFPLRGKDGRFRWFLSRATPIRDASGKIVRWFGTNTDVTELRETQAKLAEAYEEISSRAKHLDALVAKRTSQLSETIGELEAFSYSIAHDMRAPLRAMQSFSQILTSEYGGHLDEKGKDYLRRIVTSANRLDRLIQDVLTYSRISRSEIEIEPVNLDILVRGILESYPQLHVSNAQITLQEPLLAVMGNEASLTQCFSNLLGNAVKFVAPGTVPRVLVRSEKRGSRLRLWIEDNGIGIPDDQGERIFGIFQRLEKTYEGTGIGLAIVKKAVERMGGAIGYESKPGCGSQFWFELPVAEDV